MAKLNPLAIFGDKRRSFESTIGAQTMMEEGRSRLTSRQVRTRQGNEDIGKGSAWLPFLVILFVATIAAILAMMFYDNRDQKYSSEYSAATGELRMLTQRVAKASSLALQGDENAFRQLRQSRDAFNTHLQGLLNGKGTTPPVPAEVQESLKKLNGEWNKNQENVGLVLDHENALISLGKAVRTVNSKDPVLLELAEQIAMAKLQASGPGSARETALANQLVMLSQRISKNVNELLIGTSVNPEVAFLLGKDTNAFRDFVGGFLNGSDVLQLAPTTNDDVRQKLMLLDTAFKETQGAVNDIMGMLQKLVIAKQAGSEIFNDNEDLLNQTKELDAKLQEVFTHQPLYYFIFYGLIAFALLLLLMAFRAYRSVERARTEKAQQQQQASEQQNRQNQDAILRLMNELGNLADGDLTVNATVSEDMTGAIADSINYTIEELRILVTRINDAAVRVTQATEIARYNSTELLASAEQQSSEIQGAGRAVLEMAEHMRQVSNSATESAQVARQSLFAAENGAKAVENSIKGMNEIREQIQETSKRIKRLGESSQEIGEIVEMISDITEQTNVLALNAAIQAATAGEAGRGFTVVAEEVQRLAERSGEATKQIAAIVKTIQTDTQDAVSAMEQSTENVVEGAKLSDAAGRALIEIGDVSRNLTHLIEEISLATQQQAHSATQVADTMQNILQVNEQATASTQRTAAAIGELASLANDLKGSVAGFKVS